MSICLSSDPARRSSNPVFRLTIFVALLSAGLFAPQASAQHSEWPKDGSAELVALRGSTSPAERKLSFNLLLVSRVARHAQVGSFTPALDSTSVNPDGSLNVEVIAYLSPSLVASPVMADVLRVNGAISLPAYVSDHLQVRLSREQLLDLAANPNVLVIREIPRTAATTLTATNHPSAPVMAAQR